MHCFISGQINIFKNYIHIIAEVAVVVMAMAYVIFSLGIIIDCGPGPEKEQNQGSTAPVEKYSQNRYMTQEPQLASWE